MILATMFAGCAEMLMFRKIERFVHFGEASDSPDTFNFYFQHNNNPQAENKHMKFLFDQKNQRNTP